MRALEGRVRSTASDGVPACLQVEVFDDVRVGSQRFLDLAEDREGEPPLKSALAQRSATPPSPPNTAPLRSPCPEQRLAAAALGRHHPAVCS